MEKLAKSKSCFHVYASGPAQARRLSLERSLSRQFVATQSILMSSTAKMAQVYRQSQKHFFRLKKRKLRVRKVSKEEEQQVLMEEKQLEKTDSKYRTEVRLPLNLCGMPNLQEDTFLAQNRGDLFCVLGLANEIRGRITVFRLSVQRNEWSRISPAGEAPDSWRVGFGAVAHNGLIHIFGGIFFGVVGEARKYMSDYTVFNMDTCQWKKVKLQERGYQGELQLQRRNHAVGVLGDSLLIYGGVVEKEHFTNNLILVSNGGYRQILVKNEVAEIAFHRIYCHTPDARNKSGAFVLSFGGRDRSGASIPRMRRLNVRNLEKVALDNWEVLPTKGVEPEARSGHSMTPLLHRWQLFIHGGWDFQLGKLFKDSFIFDIPSLTWCKIAFDRESIPALYGHSAAAHSEGVFVFGGLDQMRRFKGKLVHIAVHVPPPLDTSSYFQSR